jgi:hypothetical protein
MGDLHVCNACLFTLSCFCRDIPTGGLQASAVHPLAFHIFDLKNTVLLRAVSVFCLVETQPSCLPLPPPLENRIRRARLLHGVQFVFWLREAQQVAPDGRLVETAHSNRDEERLTLPGFLDALRP